MLIILFNIKYKKIYLSAIFCIKNGKPYARSITYYLICKPLQDCYSINENNYNRKSNYI